MLVQLSPWNTSRTSIRLTSDSDSYSKRRRKENGGSSNDYEHCADPNHLDKRHFPVAASFVYPTTKRGLANLKVRSSEFNGCVPLLSVTTDHRISVIGRSSHTGKHGSDYEVEATLSQACKSHSSYREFSTLQYNSRPGNSGSFFPTDESELPLVPAIVDFQNERLYAVQNNNQRLCCWDMWETRGPDDRSTLKVDLLSPALSMSLLPVNKGLIYGTCQNGDVFIARVTGDSNATVPFESNTTRSKTNQLLVVEYLPYSFPKGAIHIGTFAEIRLTDKTRNSGRKRKISEADGGCVIVFYQAFSDDNTVRIVRHHAQVSSTTTEVVLEIHGPAQNVATVVDVRSIQNGGKKQHSITRAQLLISASGSIALVYTVSDGNSSTDGMENGRQPKQTCGIVGMFCASLSLSTATFVSQPIRLRGDINQFSLVTEKVLACTSEDTMYLYDMMSGAIIFKQSLTQVLSLTECSWAMTCCTRSSTIAMLYPSQDDENVLSLAASMLEYTGTKLGSSDPRASALLTGSLLASSSFRDEQKFVAGKRHVEWAFVGIEETVKDVLDMLKSCREKLSLDDRSSQPYSRVFDECVMRLTNDSSRAGKLDIQPLNGDIMPHNPQDPSTPHCKQTSYSMQVPKGTTKKSVDAKVLNGFVNSSKYKAKHCKMSPILPQSFIDGAVQITLEAIHYSSKAKGVASSRLGSDSRLVLRKLLQTGRISARLHFEGSYSLRETTKKHPLYIILRELQDPADENPLPVLRLVVELLQNCRDLSEHQLVILLDYVMKFPNANEVAQTFSESEAMTIHMEYMARLRRENPDYISVCGMRTNSRQQFALSKRKTPADAHLVLVGAELLLHMILCYSECNDVMLQIALSATLGSAAEVIVMAQLLCKMLKSSPSNVLSLHLKNSNFVRTTCRWIASLCESFEDVLKEARSPSRTDYLTYLHDAVQCAIRNSQVIIAFKDGIGLGEVMMKKEQQRDIHAIETNMGQTEEELPGYSINRCLI